MNHYANTFSLFIPNTAIGIGAVDGLGLTVKGLKASRVLIATDAGVVKAGLIDKVRRPLEREGIEHGVFDGCLPDAPFSVIQRLAEAGRKGGYDVMIALGGGSVIDTVKAASVLATGDGDIYRYLGQYKVDREGLPTIMIPTTAGTAAEWTWAAVITDDSQGIKRSIYSHYLHPKAVIIDPEMTVALPRHATAETGMDALIHGIEAYTTCKSNLISDMFAEQTIKLVAGNLRAAHGKGSRNLEARYNMAVAAALGFCFIFSGLGLVHAMAYPLQLKSHISHGVSCSLLLPFVMEYNLPVSLQRYARIAEFMGEEAEGLSLRERALKSIDAVRALSLDVEMPQRMREVGVAKEDIVGFVDNVLTYQPHVVDGNPRDASREAITKIFEAAW